MSDRESFDKRDFTFKLKDGNALNERLKDVERDMNRVETDIKYIMEEYGSKINTIGTDVAFIRGVMEGKGVKEERQFSLKSGIYITAISAAISIAVSAVLFLLGSPLGITGP